MTWWRGARRRAYPCASTRPWKAAGRRVATRARRPALRLDPDLAHLRAALALAPFDGPGAQRLLEPVDRGAPPPAVRNEPAREGAALLYVYMGPRGPCFPLTLRRDDLAEHRGQVSLPGGRPEHGEDLWSTALREAEEEIGLGTDGIELLGVLAPVSIVVTHTRLHVHVATGPAPERFTPQASEVARVGSARLADLLDPACRRPVRRRVRGGEIEVPALHLDGFEVWGATAMALSELAERLRVSATL